MAMMLSKTYDALVAAGAPEEKARAAAEELAGYDSELADIKSDLRLLKWMVGTNFAATLAVLFKLFVH
jgi:hypothetical protein